MLTLIAVLLRKTVACGSKIPLSTNYGLAPDTPEPEIIAHLLKLYADKVKGLLYNSRIHST